MFTNVLERTIKEANKSSYHYKIGCVIFSRKGQILSQGYNKINLTNPKVPRQYQKWHNSIHAEVDAIVKAKVKLKGETLIVLRVNGNNEIRNSKPCEKCWQLIRNVGIRFVYCGTSNGQIHKMKVG